MTPDIDRFALECIDAYAETGDRRLRVTAERRGEFTVVLGRMAGDRTIVSVLPGTDEEDAGLRYMMRAITAMAVYHTADLVINTLEGSL